MRKLKLDENFPPSCVSIFRLKDIDASSVFEQNMNGSTDDTLFEVCIAEERILITFDLDFANIIRYPSAPTSGIIIVRTKKKINLPQIESICEKLANFILHHEIEGNLCIVEDTKIRIRKPDE